MFFFFFFSLARTFRIFIIHFSLDFLPFLRFAFCHFSTRCVCATSVRVWLCLWVWVWVRGVVCHIAELFCGFSFASCQLRFVCVCCFSVSVLNISWLIIGQSVRREVQNIPFSLSLCAQPWESVQLPTGDLISVSVSVAERSVNKIFTILLIFFVYHKAKCSFCSVPNEVMAKLCFPAFPFCCEKKVSFRRFVH